MLEIGNLKIWENGSRQEILLGTGDAKEFINRASQNNAFDIILDERREIDDWEKEEFCDNILTYNKMLQPSGALFFRINWQSAFKLQLAMQELKRKINLRTRAFWVIDRNVPFERRKDALFPNRYEMLAILAGEDFHCKAPELHSLIRCVTKKSDRGIGASVIDRILRLVFGNNIHGYFLHLTDQFDRYAINNINYSVCRYVGHCSISSSHKSTKDYIERRIRQQAIWSI